MCAGLRTKNKYCPKCGREYFVSKDEKYCPKCGKVVKRHQTFKSNKKK